MVASGVRGVRAAGTDESPLVTSCGRRIAVKEMRLAALDRPIGRVTLDVGPDQGDEHGVWASLTPAEARELARRLLAHAALVEPAGPPDQEAPRPHEAPVGPAHPAGTRGGDHR
ncbi:hypothetical protein [Streptomyces sp. NPDC002580]|uniref:hypothetical protein n=1 Tax=Streptomyces sp. NPDC002580 TaxID=3364653 RepID=UPI00368CB092